MDQNDLKHRFMYHPPKDESVADLHAATRQNCLELAIFINERAPEGREKAVAMTKLEECMFWVNAAIARGKN